MSIFLPPLDDDVILGLELDLDLGLELDLDLGLGLEPSARLVAPTRRNTQKREIDETIIELGSTYLILLVRLNNVLNLLGRFLTQSIASKLVSGLYVLTIPNLVFPLFTGAVVLSVSRYTLNVTVHFSLFNKSEI